MIYWTEQAVDQLDRAEKYIALSNSEQVAANVAGNIANQVQQLMAFPLLGRPGRVAGTRELVISNTPFIVAYKVQAQNIVVLALYHGAQRWPDMF